MGGVLLPVESSFELLGGGRFGGRRGFGFLAAGPVVLLLELFDAARRVDELHLAGEERMARGADFDRNILLGAARHEAVAAAADDFALFVFRMDAFFHGGHSLSVEDSFNPHYTGPDESDKGTDQFAERGRVG